MYLFISFKNIHLLEGHHSFFYDAQTNQENEEEEGGVVDKETERTMFMKNSFHFCIQYRFEKIHAEFDYLFF